MMWIIHEFFEGPLNIFEKLGIYSIDVHRLVLQS